MELGITWWQQWWVPAGLKRFCDSAYYGSTAFTAGVEAPGGACGPWLTLLAKTIKRSESAAVASADAEDAPETNAFPLLLLLVCVFRQGNIEAPAVYSLARALSTLNARALAAHEGFGESAYLDAKVSETESTNTLLPIAVELYGLLEKEVFPYVLGFGLLGIFLSVGVPVGIIGVLWWSTSAGLNTVIDFFLHEGAFTPDPLDF